MTIHKNYFIDIEWPPDSGITQEAYVDFCHTPYNAGGADEPPTYEEVEIFAVYVDGEDVIRELAVADINEIEASLLKCEVEEAYANY